MHASVASGSRLELVRGSTRCRAILPLSPLGFALVIQGLKVPGGPKAQIDSQGRLRRVTGSVRPASAVAQWVAAC
jgi:hypothetical protein